MTREEAKKFLIILKAYSEGRKIQRKNVNGVWYDVSDLSDFYLYSPMNIDHWRVVERQSYRPFDNGNECFEEMQHHQPFGWIKNGDTHIQIMSVNADDVVMLDTVAGAGETTWYPYETVFDDFKFIDGTPFGKLIEKK